MESIIEGENKSLLITKSDDEILELVSATHDPDDQEDNTTIDDDDLETLFYDSRKIVSNAYLMLDDVLCGQQDSDEELEVRFSSSLCTIIKSVGLELIFSSSYEDGGGDETMTLESRTLQVLQKLSKYSWEAKAVMVFASFALEYVQSDLLNKSVGSLQLKQATDVYKAIELLTETLEFAENIFPLTSSGPSASSSKPFINENTGIETPVLVYWLIATTIACWAQIRLATCQEGNKAHDLSQFSEKIRYFFVHQNAERLLCNWNEEKGGFLSPAKTGPRTERLNLAHAMEVLKALILPKNTAQTILIDGSTNQPVEMDMLMWKNLLLLFSGLDISDADDLSPLKLVYEETKQENNNKIVWIPVVESWTDVGQKQFEELKSKMPWYIVQCSSPLATGMRFIKKEWSFKGKPILVVMSSSGTVKNINALPLIRKEGMQAFPFHEQHKKKQSFLARMF